MSGGHIEKPPKIPSQGIRHDIILNCCQVYNVKKCHNTMTSMLQPIRILTTLLCQCRECSTMIEYNTKVFQRRKKTIVQLLVFAQRDTDLGEIPPHPPPPLTSPLHNTILHTLHRALHTYSVQSFHHWKNNLRRLSVISRMQQYSARLHKRGKEVHLKKIWGRYLLSAHFISSLQCYQFF